MSLLGLLLVVCLIIFVLGNPIAGPRVYQGYNYGWWPGGLGLILAVLLVLYLFGGLRIR